MWTEAASDTFPAAFGGEAANGTAGVVQAVTGGKNTIGYSDASAAGKLSKASLLVGGKPLQPTADAAAGHSGEKPPPVASSSSAPGPSTGRPSRKP